MGFKRITPAEYFAMDQVDPERNYMRIGKVLVSSDEAYQISEGSLERFSVAYTLARAPNYRTDGSLVEIKNPNKLKRITDSFLATGRFVQIHNPPLTQELWDDEYSDLESDFDDES